MLLYVYGLSAPWIPAARGDDYRFHMAWHESGFSDVVKTDISKEGEPFRVEPEINGQTVWRGTFEIGPESKKESLGFLWIQSQGQLYVDRNRDGDLTNDGVLERVSKEYSSEFLQEFASFPLSFISENGEYRYHLQPVLIDAGKYHFAYVKVVSGYSGIIAIKGKEYDIRIVDCLKGTIQREDTLTIGSALVTDPNLLCKTGVPENIFLAGQLYRLMFEFEKNESGFPLLQCILTEEDAQLGKLRIECPGIKQLILANEHTLVVCDLDQQITDVPIGSYACRSLVWGDLSPFYAHKINITQGGEYTLAAGGPLRSSVDVWQKGNVLQMNYLLLGAGDERYSIFQVKGFDYVNRPSFAIYKGPIQVGSGKFEYG